MNIVEYVDTLSEEEKKQFKDLIAECLDRENNIKESSRIAKENITKLFIVITKIISDIHTISEELNSVNNELLLRSIPDNKFFNA